MLLGKVEYFSLSSALANIILFKSSCVWVSQCACRNREQNTLRAILNDYRFSTIIDTQQTTAIDSIHWRESVCVRVAIDRKRHCARSSTIVWQLAAIDSIHWKDLVRCHCVRNRTKNIWENKRKERCGWIANALNARIFSLCGQYYQLWHSIVNIFHTVFIPIESSGKYYCCVCSLHIDWIEWHRLLQCVWNKIEMSLLCRRILFAKFHYFFFVLFVLEIIPFLPRTNE